MPETDQYTEKLDLILKNQVAFATELQALKGQLTPSAPPTQTGGLYDFKRPEVRNTEQWPLNVDMNSADTNEALQRAFHGVNWRGGRMSEKTYEEAWAEIEALQKAKPFDPILKPYIDASLDPEFAGFALLTGLIQPVAYDGITFGVNAGVRKGYAGKTVQSFMDDQMAIVNGGGTPSGA